jgi:hypothetical protein
VNFGPFFLWGRGKSRKPPKNVVMSKLFLLQPTFLNLHRRAGEKITKSSINPKSIKPVYLKSVSALHSPNKRKQSQEEETEIKIE